MCQCNKSLALLHNKVSPGRAWISRMAAQVILVCSVPDHPGQHDHCQRHSDYMSDTEVLRNVASQVVRRWGLLFPPPFRCSCRRAPACGSPTSCPSPT